MLLPLVVVTFLLSACADTTEKQFSWPTAELPSAPASPGSEVQGGISILSTSSFTIGSTDQLANLVYDGVRLLIPFEYNLTFPGSQVTFQYFSTSLVSQTSSNSVYPGIAADYTGARYATAHTAGASALIWATTSSSTTLKLSIRDNSNGTVQSTVDLDLTNYGCRSNGGDGSPFAYCGGTFYGACSDTAGKLRFFSFNSAGAMQSAVTTSTTIISSGHLNAMTCYAGNSLILVTKYSTSNLYNGFHRFDLNFQAIATDSTTTYLFPIGLRDIVGIATDGSTLYLQGRTDQTRSPATFAVGTATLGKLK